MDILYASITSSQQVTTQPCHLIGIETTGHSDQIVYNEGDDSKTAANLVSHIESSTYYCYNNIIFPLGGVKCANGIYVVNSGGTGTIYYHYGKTNDSILYCPVIVDTQVCSQPCYLVGGECYGGTIAVYNEATSGKTAANLVGTLKVGSYRHYSAGHWMFNEPILCNGIYADVTDGTGTIYYKLKK